MTRKDCGRDSRAHRTTTLATGAQTPWQSRRWLGMAATAAGMALLPATHAAGQGALTQLQGTAGCVSETGSAGNCTDGLALTEAQSIAVTGNGVNAYVAAGGSDGVAAFLRNPATGALTQLAGTAGCVTESGTGGLCADGRALLGAREVALPANAKALYVAAPGSDAIAVFVRDASTGGLTQLAGVAGCVSEDGTGGTCADGFALNGARSVALAANGKSLYVASRDSDAVVAFARDNGTGALTQLSGPGACVSDNGTGGLCANGVALDFPTSVAVSRDGRHVYVATAGSHAVAAFARDKSTGALTQLPGTAACVSDDGTGGLCTDGRGLLGAFSVAVSRNGKNVYVASRDAGAIAVFARNKTTGALTQLDGLLGCLSEDGSGGICADAKALAGAVSVVVSRDGKNVYAASEGSSAVAAFARERKTGALAQLAGLSGCISEDGTGATCGDGKGLAEARAVALSRNGRSAYVASATSDAIAAFERD
jgi:6-phosphogluconolactonase (cycloisomerase 2 family)